MIEVGNSSTTASQRQGKGQVLRKRVMATDKLLFCRKFFHWFTLSNSLPHHAIFWFNADADRLVLMGKIE